MYAFLELVPLFQALNVVPGLRGYPARSGSFELLASFFEGGFPRQVLVCI